MKFYAVPFSQLRFGKNGIGIDFGRFNVTFESGDLYRFRTPPLFNVDKTAPYGHSGLIPTLREAVVAQLDPMKNIDPGSMDTLARHEFYKRMAASSPTFMSLSVLDDEVLNVERLLKTLSFE